MRTPPAQRELQAIYRQADQAYARFSCPASGECCQLAARGRQPWLWSPEWEALLAALDRQNRPLPTPRQDGGCPFLDDAGRRCTVYADRPFGCRTYFCDRRTGPPREPLEQVVALSRRLEAVAQRANPDEAGPTPLIAYLEVARAALHAG